jgi:hypothetical protein
MPFTQQHNSNDKRIKTMWQLSFKQELSNSIELSKDKIKLKNLIIELTKNFHEPIPKLISETDNENIMATPIYDIDPLTIEQLQKFSRITLIGIT